MHRFFIEGTFNPGEEIDFSGQVAKQMSRVLRLDPGARVIAVDPQGWELTVMLREVSPRRVSGVVESRERANSEPPVKITLAQGLPKHDKMDFVVQKCTEVGVGSIVPVVTRRSVVRPGLGEGSGGRLERWRRIAREAAEQAGRTLVPEVAPVTDLTGALPRLAEADLFLVLWEEERSMGFKEVLRGRGAGGARIGSVSILIGPEGGLSQEEVEEAQRHGALSVTIGPRLLRTETAGLVVLSVLLYEIGDMG